MTNLHQIGVELDKLNAASAAAFGVTAQALQPQIEPAELDAWAVVCLKIAGSGWHGWEATNLYLALSLGLRTAGGSELLLGVGRYGSALSGFSIDPVSVIFAASRPW